MHPGLARPPRLPTPLVGRWPRGAKGISCLTPGPGWCMRLAPGETGELGLGTRVSAEAPGLCPAAHGAPGATLQASLSTRPCTLKREGAGSPRGDRAGRTRAVRAHRDPEGVPSHLPLFSTTGAEGGSGEAALVPPRPSRLIPRPRQLLASPLPTGTSPPAARWPSSAPASTSLHPTWALPHPAAWGGHPGTGPRAGCSANRALWAAREPHAAEAAGRGLAATADPAGSRPVGHPRSSRAAAWPVGPRCLPWALWPFSLVGSLWAWGIPAVQLGQAAGRREAGHQLSTLGKGHGCCSSGLTALAQMSLGPEAPGPLPRTGPGALAGAGVPPCGVGAANGLGHTLECRQAGACRWA